MNDPHYDFHRFQQHLAPHSNESLVQMIAARAALGNQSFKGQSLSSKREQLLRHWGLTHVDAEPIERAIAAAWNARLSAYAPYSHFHVGASVLASTGGMWVGANIENSSYGLTLCAERVALASARLHEGSALMLVCIVAKTDEPITPCGACRQWIVELAPHAIIGMLGNEGIERWCTPEELLPWAFGAAFFHHHT